MFLNDEDMLQHAEGLPNSVKLTFVEIKILHEITEAHNL